MANQHNSDGHLNGNTTMPIAIVGMGFRGPGDATNVENLWKMMSEGRESWSKIPKEKWNHEAFYHPDANRHGTVGCTFRLNLIGGD
jgi:acyl transferase domain-containing protein